MSSSRRSTVTDAEPQVRVLHSSPPADLHNQATKVGDLSGLARDELLLAYVGERPAEDNIKTAVRDVRKVIEELHPSALERSTVPAPPAEPSSGPAAAPAERAGEEGPPLSARAPESRVGPNARVVIAIAAVCAAAAAALLLR
jgi:hypothetical protein